MFKYFFWKVTVFSVIISIFSLLLIYKTIKKDRIFSEILEYTRYIKLLRKKQHRYEKKYFYYKKKIETREENRKYLAKKLMIEKFKIFFPGYTIQKYKKNKQNSYYA